MPYHITSSVFNSFEDDF
jgi:WD40 repeat protein